MPPNRKLAEPLQQIDRTWVHWRGRSLVYFGGCDYHRLSSHPQLIAAFQVGLESGLSVSASRLTTGNHRIYVDLETALARFFRAKAAVLLPTGYVTNLAVAEGLAGRFANVLLEERAHASLTHAAAQFGCPVSRFSVGRLNELHRLTDWLKRQGRLIVLTDGLFSHDGSVAPLKGILAAVPQDALVLVDDAHGGGVIGRQGRGTPEFTGVDRKRVIQTITLSKAFGVSGGAVLCDRALAGQIVNRSPAFGAATPMPLPLAQAALESVELLRREPGFLERLVQNTAWVKQALSGRDWPSLQTPGPVLAMTPQNPAQAARVRRSLLKHGVFPSLIRYGSGPPSGYYRFAIASEHSREQLERLVAALAAF